MMYRIRLAIPKVKSREICEYVYIIYLHHKGTKAPRVATMLFKKGDAGAQCVRVCVSVSLRLSALRLCWRVETRSCCFIIVSSLEHNCPSRKQAMETTLETNAPMYLNICRYKLSSYLGMLCFQSQAIPSRAAS